MLCNLYRSKLHDAAGQYIHLGYRIGVSNRKELVKDYYTTDENWDSITLMLDGLVCVDLNCFISLGEQYPLPETLKERSPRGLHFFYRLPRDFKAKPKFGWRKKVNLLTKDNVTSLYGKKPDQRWKGHVLCSPSRGYTRIYPKVTPFLHNLPIAPQWVLDALSDD